MDQTHSQQELWTLHSAQQDELQQMTEEQPLVGSLEKGFGSLKQQFQGASNGFLHGIQALERRSYKGFRRVRGDGNCFFRGFMFRLVETLVTQPNEKERERLVKVFRDSLDYLLQVGYERVSVETFQEMLVEFFEQDILSLHSSDDVSALFNNKGESEHLVWYSRVMCAAYLKHHADRFLPFLGDGWVSIDDYCSKEVEIQGRECEQVHIIALSEVLHVKVMIEYLSAGDGSSGGEPVSLGPDDAALKISFIYRPGHYDVLYS